MVTARLPGRAAVHILETYRPRPVTFEGRTMEGFEGRTLCGKKADFITYKLEKGLPCGRCGQLQKFKEARLAAE